MRNASEYINDKRVTQWDTLDNDSRTGGRIMHEILTADILALEV